MNHQAPGFPDLLINVTLLGLVSGPLLAAQDGSDLRTEMVFLRLNICFPVWDLDLCSWHS